MTTLPGLKPRVSAPANSVLERPGFQFDNRFVNWEELNVIKWLCNDDGFYFASHLEKRKKNTT